MSSSVLYYTVLKLPFSAHIAEMEYKQEHKHVRSTSYSTSSDAYTVLNGLPDLRNLQLKGCTSGTRGTRDLNAFLRPVLVRAP